MGDIRYNDTLKCSGSDSVFNTFYKDLIQLLREQKCGIMIDGATYNVYCYADDILLSSTTPTGLQTLIDIATKYITQQGLRFNPSKTTCMSFGKPAFRQNPEWTIQGSKLQIVDAMTYLGASLSTDGGSNHVSTRIKSANRAFYGLQHGGLHFNGIAPEVAAHIYKVGVQTILTYGCESIFISAANLRRLKTAEGNIVKAFLGLRRSSHTTPLLEALGITPCDKLIGIHGLNLLRTTAINQSGGASFYQSLLTLNKKWSHNTLVHRVHTQLADIDSTKFVLNVQYAREIKQKLKCITHDGANGVIDSIRDMFCTYNGRARDIVNQIVSPF